MFISFRSAMLAILALSGLAVTLGPMPVALAEGPAPAIASPIRTTSAHPAPAKPQTVPALFTSDIHFDPFHDPDRVKDLVAAPVTQWRQILSAPPSPNQQEAFDSLQQACHAKGVDTPFALLDSSLQAMHTHQPAGNFMMVSGDLIAHAFTCRYNTLFPGSSPSDYQSFVLKTLNFVIGELRAAFPGKPVYVALGNNDSGCGDYKLDAGSTFLAETGKIVAEGLPSSERQHAIREFAAGGYYSVTMASPMLATRLIVVNDLFLSGKYTTCPGQPDTAPAAEQMFWLEQQLKQARAANQKVWVMGHIPPGIDPYGTISNAKDVCAGKAPVTFLATGKMADELVEYADVVRLGIFAHTHMDEMRLLRPETSQATAQGEHSVAIKMVSSISPVDGNIPSFTVARVDPFAAVLDDYDVVKASNQTGIDTVWTVEYNYGQTYHEPQFSSSTVKALIGEFKADGAAKTPESQAYIRNYFVGDMSREISPFWPEYVCALDNHTASAFAACVCSAAPK